MKNISNKSKNLKKSYESFDFMKLYSPEEAISILIKNKTVKFDATAEIHFRLGINPKHADQQIRTNISLPNGTGKDVNVICFCEDDQVKDAKAAGASEAGLENLIAKILKGWTDFDVVVATPAVMRHIAKAAKVLGPKGLMPSPKAGTVTPKPVEVIKALKAGQIEIKNDKAGIIHSIFGKISFGEKKLAENLTTLIKAVKDAKPSGQKGEYFKTVTINSTMGPGVKVSV